MKDPVTKVDLEINTNILSTVVDNNGVEFAVTLNNMQMMRQWHFRIQKIGYCLYRPMKNMLRSKKWQVRALKVSR